MMQHVHADIITFKIMGNMSNGISQNSLPSRTVMPKSLHGQLRHEVDRGGCDTYTRC